MSSYKLRNKDYESICKVKLCNWNRKEQATPDTTPEVKKFKKKKGLFGHTLSLTTSHLLLLDVTPVKNIKNTEMAIKILKNGKKILKAPSQGWRHCFHSCQHPSRRNKVKSVVYVVMLVSVHQNIPVGRINYHSSVSSPLASTQINLNQSVGPAEMTYHGW